MENQDLQDFKVLLERWACLVPRETRVIEVLLDSRVFLDLLDLLEKRGHQENQERMVQLEHLAQEVLLAWMVLLEQWGTLVQWDLVDHLEKRVRGVHQENLDPLVLLGLQESHLDLTWQLFLL